MTTVKIFCGHVEEARIIKLARNGDTLPEQTKQTLGPLITQVQKNGFKWGNMANKIVATVAKLRARSLLEPESLIAKPKH